MNPNMSETKLPRPGQATLAGWLIVLGSLLTVVGAWDQISGLRSLDTRERVEEMLAEPPLAGSGIGLDNILEIMHVMALVTGAMAAAAVILGWHVLQRSKQARLALTIIAAPLFIGGMFGGGFWSTLAAVAVVLLWMSPTRDWFDGVSPAKREARGSGDPDQEAYVPPAPPEVSTGSTTAESGSTSGTVRLSDKQPPPWTGAVDRTTKATPSRRPGAVTAAAVLTWIGSGITALMMLASAVAATANPDLILEQLRKQAEGDAAMQEVVGLYTTDVVVASAWAGAVLVALVCIAAAVFAVFAVRRHPWARVALMISAGVSGLSLLLFALAFPPAVVLFGAAVATFSFLLRPEVAAWFRSRR
jgi:hypothetical protein